MKELLPLTPEQLARAEELLRNPPSGSRIKAARDFGIDLTLMMEQLRLTPDERARCMQDASDAPARGESRRWLPECAPDAIVLAELEALSEVYEQVTPSDTAR